MTSHLAQAALAFPPTSGYNACGDQTLRVWRASHSANEWDPSWSPDGTQIVFMSDRSGNREIYVMNSDGSNVRQLTNTKSMGGAPKSERQSAWSLAGGTLVFESRRSGSLQIYVMGTGGQNQRALTNTASANYSPKWSPDGGGSPLPQPAITSTISGPRSMS